MSSSWVLLLSVLAKQHWLMLTWAKVVLIAVSLLCVILYLHSSGLLFVQLAVVGSLARLEVGCPAGLAPGRIPMMQGLSLCCPVVAVRLLLPLWWMMMMAAAVLAGGHRQQRL